MNALKTPNRDGLARLAREGPSPARAPEPPLVVDLDGTLLRSDSLIESVFVLAKQRPASLLALPWALRHGRAFFKRWVAERAQPEIATLPFDEAVLEVLRAERSRGRRIVMATAADQLLAHRIAQHLGLFDAVFASDGHRNLAGRIKGERLVAAYGAKGFDYVGDSLRDVPIWRRARKALVADAGSRDRLAGEPITVEPLASGPPGPSLPRLQAWLREIRWHHWIKNGLVLLPVVLAHRVFDPGALADATMAALAFCLVASSIYLLNDLFDLPADRKDPRKRLRPIASGRLPLLHALAAVPALWLAAAALAAGLHAGAGRLLATYVLGMIAYSVRLKDWRYVDAAVLGGGYTLRVLLGGLVIGQGIDPWLACWTAPTFFGLALLKRRAELACAVARAPGDANAHARAYRVRHGRRMEAVGRTAGWLGIAVLASMPLLLANDAAVTIGRWLGCALIAAWT
ncbi:MAG TPA: UbiA family prenyltransferase, partial [Burkholderiaceae bacterium]